ncbi:iron-sulfur cluster assembly scaffold protein [Candidatus Shapirobacteria bacterium CG10_big_fil_rev_8_21_14_0_10_38_14]|uniref:Iron-sulfur cluster assembly scaffold protein n=1 Tax=Candidatus Shapirobacteria bacterium CG10_big_fil_rev_8_21_14_0_10_38_14 TaxID=1974483 RepID=A0A2M8L612_9BACT|nr:MAG: iron-sulfur cluster assembly scaffold protein [Candidatus Shapirobacteria bacterium CG10_big_fil_rev_8_21_14_0_10_38_14]
MYSKKVLEHVRHPRNLGEIKNPDGMATVGNRICGDVMRLYIKVEKKNGKEYIKEAKFQTLGCGAALATSSIITTMVKGKALDEAGKITDKAVAEALGGLPPVKFHCSVLAADALKKAIEDYRKKK